MRDQLSTPLERAVWFVEHAARTRGAAHLKVASRNLSPLQKHAIDVLLVALAALIVAFLLLRKLVSRLIRRATKLESKNSLAQNSLKLTQLKQE
jgi:glucuronosyltransferase